MDYIKSKSFLYLLIFIIVGILGALYLINSASGIEGRGATDTILEKKIHTIKESATTSDTVPEKSVDMASWQTYRNEEYGVEFLYPADYEVSNISGSSTSKDVFVLKVHSQGSVDAVAAITILPKAQGKYLADALGVKSPVQATPEYFLTTTNLYAPSVIRSVGPIVIDTRSGVQFEHTEFNTNLITLLKNPDDTFFEAEISLTYENPVDGEGTANPKLKNIYNQILSTTSFIDS